MSRKEGGRGLASIEDWVNVSIQGLEKHIKKAKKDYLPKPVIAMSPEEQQNDNKTRKQKSERELYGYFKWQTGNISYEKFLT